MFFSTLTVTSPQTFTDLCLMHDAVVQSITMVVAASKARVNVHL